MNYIKYLLYFQNVPVYFCPKGNLLKPEFQQNVYDDKHGFGQSFCDRFTEFLLSETSDVMDISIDVTNLSQFAYVTTKTSRVACSQALLLLTMLTTVIRCELRYCCDVASRSSVIVYSHHFNNFPLRFGKTSFPKLNARIRQPRFHRLTELLLSDWSCDGYSDR